MTIYDNQTSLLVTLVKKGFDEEFVLKTMDEAIKNKTPATFSRSNYKATVHWTKTKRSSYQFILICD
jgi:hypothetical protein